MRWIYTCTLKWGIQGLNCTTSVFAAVLRAGQCAIAGVLRCCKRMYVLWQNSPRLMRNKRDHPQLMCTWSTYTGGCLLYHCKIHYSGLAYFKTSSGTAGLIAFFAKYCRISVPTIRLWLFCLCLNQELNCHLANRLTNGILKTTTQSNSQTSYCHIH